MTRSALSAQYRLVAPDDLVTTVEQWKQAWEQLSTEHIDALALQIGTFPEGDVVAAISRDTDIPVVLVTVEEDLTHSVPLNSTCGGMLAGFILREHGRSYLHAHVNPSRSNGYATLAASARTALAVGALSGEPVLLIGDAPPGFLPCESDLDQLQRLLGVRPREVPIERVVEAYRSGARRDLPHQAFPTRSGGELDKQTLRVIEGMYGALAQVISEEKAGIVAVRDWPELLFMEPSGSAWPALGWLQDEDGLVVGPERDVNGAITLAIERNITGEHAFLGDVVKTDEARNELAMWHYGASEKLAAPDSTIGWADDGRELDFWLREGKCAVARLGWERDRYRMVAFDGRVTNHPATFGRTGAYVEMDSAVSSIIEQLRAGGWEHHLCLSYGTTANDLGDVARLLGIEAVRL
jgi:L-fucose isomerase-like protein